MQEKRKRVETFDFNQLTVNGYHGSQIKTVLDSMITAGKLITPDCFLDHKGRVIHKQTYEEICNRVFMYQKEILGYYGVTGKLVYNPSLMSIELRGLK